MVVENGFKNGTIRVVTVIDWAFRIFCLAIPVISGVVLDLQDRITVIEGNRYTSREGQATERTVVALEERYFALRSRLERLQREVDRLTDRIEEH